MALLRSPAGHEFSVPDASVPYFPDHEVIEAGSDIPPRGGAGSGADAWSAYAERKGVEVPEGATRDAIIAALDEAGVPTE
jgi:hypothetical protein